MRLFESFREYSCLSNHVCCRVLQDVAVLLHSLFREYSDLTNHIEEDFAGQCFYCFNDILMFVEAPDY